MRKYYRFVARLYYRLIPCDERTVGINWNGKSMILRVITTTLRRRDICPLISPCFSGFLCYHEACKQVQYRPLCSKKCRLLMNSFVAREAFVVSWKIHATTLCLPFRCQAGQRGCETAIGSRVMVHTTL